MGPIENRTGPEPGAVTVGELRTRQTQREYVSNPTDTPWLTEAQDKAISRAKLILQQVCATKRSGTYLGGVWPVYVDSNSYQGLIAIKCKFRREGRHYRLTGFHHAGDAVKAAQMVADVVYDAKADAGWNPEHVTVNVRSSLGMIAYALNRQQAARLTEEWSLVDPGNIVPWDDPTWADVSYGLGED